MVISKTPYRIGFFGGGTDIPDFYSQSDFGAVFNAALSSSVYVTIHRRFDSNIRVCYTKTEIANSVLEIKHDIVREVLRLFGISDPLEITFVGDVPSGTGLGSSSSVTVGLIKALSCLQQVKRPKDETAEMACYIELNVLKKPIGKQDQYAAAFGGLNLFKFNPNGSVNAFRHYAIGEWLKIFDSCLILYTGATRSADDVLVDQNKAVPVNIRAMERMRDIAVSFSKSPTYNNFVAALNENWRIKRSLTSNISTGLADDWIAKSFANGALAAKLCGAGGGGFLLVVAPPNTHAAIRRELGYPKEISMRVNEQGSHICYTDECAS